MNDYTQIELSVRVSDGSFEMTIKLPRSYRKEQMVEAVGAWLKQAYVLVELDAPEEEK